MRLVNGTIRPGTVQEVLEDGIIKATAPGLFSFTDDTSKLPPIMYFFIGNNANAYSKPVKGDEVWIMNFQDNPRQLYWFRKDRLQNFDNIPMNDENVEIVCNRDANGDWATIYFSDGSGWIIGKGDSVIQIRPDGTIKLDSGMGKGIIDINGKGISLGAEGRASHTAAYGDGVVDALLSIVIALKQIQIAATPNPFTTPIGIALTTAIPMIENKLSKIESSIVTLE